MFAQIIDQIRNRILNGTLKPGDLLPPERQFSDMMGVNRHTVREALKVLEYMGVAEGKTGVGTVIKNVGQEVLVDRISHAANFSPRRFLFELMELRKALEPSIAALAPATHNSIFVIVTQPIMSMLSQYRETGLQMKGRRVRAYQEHERIYAAIKDRRPEAARSAMIDHLVQVEEMLNRIEDSRSPGSDACGNDSFTTIEREE